MLLRAAPAPVIAWPTVQYNPNPLPDDLILPLPCGGAMAFRAVATPARVGLAPRLAGHDFSALAGPFRDGQGHPRFLLGKYEVNGLQVAAVGAYASSSDCPSLQLPDGRLAASSISWQGAMAFGDDWTGWLLAQGQAIPDCSDGASPCLPRADSGPAVVRLPTEDEWVFAARGGLAVTPEVFAQARYPMPDGIDHYAWSKDNAGGQVHPLGTRAPGPLGLHDLYGNVSEMLLERTFAQTHQGQAPAFVIRGGGRYDPSEKLSADLRYEVPIHNEAGRTRTSDTGFRVVVSTGGAPKVVPLAPTGDPQGPRLSDEGPQLAAADAFLPMMRLPGSTFRMGCSSTDQRGCPRSQLPAHLVTVRPFRIGRYNVTQAQWQKIMGSNPSQVKDDDRPVDSVSWYDVQDFLTRLNTQVTGKPYRLPTEAEWEYAARGGAHADDCSECASASNGTVLEWVKDCYHYNYEGAPSDGSEWRVADCVSAARVVRGGPWLKLSGWDRVTSRRGVDPGGRYRTLGLRLAQDL